MIAALIVVAAYVAAQMLSDIASLKIVLLSGLSMDAGTLIYPLTFTLRDLVHKTLGIAAARALILIAAAINLAMALLFWFIAQLPGDPQVGAQSEFAAVLAPVWRIVIASIIAEVVSELLDTEIYRRWRARFGMRHQWGRTLSSNAVAIPVDTLLFAFIAFYGVLPLPVVWAIVVSNILVKGGATLLSWPLIYAVPERAAGSPGAFAPVSPGRGD